MPTVEIKFNRALSPWVGELQAALEADGYETQLRPMAGVMFSWDIALRLSEHVGNHFLDALIALVVVQARKLGRLRRSAPRPRVRIYGPDGKILREVVISAEGEDEVQAN